MVLALIIVVALVVLIGAIYFGMKAKDKILDEETEKFNTSKVLDALVNTNSELYKFIKRCVHESVDSALMNGGYDYNFFKDNLAESITNIIDHDIQENGSGWLHTEVEPIITQENLAIAVRSIMNMPEIDSEIARLFVDKITANISEAESHEKNALEMNKEFDEAPGRDEELHPRIPTPGEDSEDNSDEMSIEALASTGTVEDV